MPADLAGTLASAGPYALCSGRREALERGRHPAAAEGDLRELQPHLHAGERSRQHDVVERAEVPDAEYLPLEPAEAGARERSNRSRMSFRSASASWPAGIISAAPSGRAR